jgi:mono/diheme cytochrome c family protein
MKVRTPFGRRPALTLLVLAAAVGAVVTRSAVRVQGQSATSIEDHFKYGSIGTEGTVGVPYWIWQVLPIVFEDKLPKRPGVGYERLGFVNEGASHGRPIGQTLDDERVGLNCATCHVGTVRSEPGGAPRIYLGMPANRMDLQGYARFLSAVADDPRFESKTLLEAINKVNPNLSWWDSLRHRVFVIPFTRRAIQKRTVENSWFDRRPPQGPGRVDTFNPYKRMLGLDLDNDSSVGTVDLPSIWNQRPRQGLWLHWDGNNDSVEERNKSAAIGAGATPKSLNIPALSRIENWLLDLPAPAFPPERIRQELVGRGQTAYQGACARCHDIGAPAVGQVTPIEAIGTDPERLNSFTPELAEKMGTIGEGYPWQFKRFRKTNGYANMPLDGIWLRSPYLHNGSVPTLRALLFPAERPVVFYSGYDVFDWTNVGYLSSGPDAERDGVKFDTTLKGNGNGGHVYGQELPAADREAIIEYLKTR